MTKADGTPARIVALKEGDAILAATADGALTLDTVSLLSIAKPDASASFVMLTTNHTLTAGAKANLTLTPEHHVPVGGEAADRLRVKG